MHTLAFYVYSYTVFELAVHKWTHNYAFILAGLSKHYGFKYSNSRMLLQMLSYTKVDLNISKRLSYLVILK